MNEFLMKNKLLNIVKKYDLLEIDVKLMDSGRIEKYKETMLDVYVNYLYNELIKFNCINYKDKSIELRDYGFIYEDKEKGYKDIIM